MAFLVPNAPSTAGTFFDVLDQAEPDAVDFEVLGNIGVNYVVSGCSVASTGSASTVALTAGVVVVAGHVYALAANSTLSIPAAPVNKRFDLVVARLSGTSVTAAVVAGNDSATDPYYPLSSSVTGSYVAASNYNPATDVVLAALYRPGSSAVTSSRIVDKRAFGATVVVAQASSAPTSTLGVSQAGVLNYKTGTPSGTGTGLFIGDQNGNWTEAAASVAGPYMPIGAMVMWPSRQAVPTNYVEANGQLLVPSAYPSLFAAFGTDYGGNGTTTFGVPNMAGDCVPKGTTQTTASQTNSPGAVVGADTHTLTAGELAPHTHSVDPPATVTSGHFHVIDPPYTIASVYDPTHTHPVDPPITTLSMNSTTNYGFYGGGGLGGAVGGVAHLDGAADQGTVDIAPFTSGAAYTGIGVAVDIAPFYSASSQDVVDISAFSSASAGSGSAMSLVQKSMYTRYIIRAL